MVEYSLIFAKQSKVYQKKLTRVIKDLCQKDTTLCLQKHLEHFQL